MKFCGMAVYYAVCEQSGARREGRTYGDEA